jgi:hypothetical protein
VAQAYRFPIIFFSRQLRKDIIAPLTRSVYTGRDRICRTEVARMLKKSRQKKAKQPKPKPKERIFPPPKGGKGDFVHPDPTSVRAPDDFE